MQGYVENEVNFNWDGSCAKTCADYDWTRLHSCQNSTACGFNFLDRQKTRCEGEIRNCTFIESDMSMCSNVMTPQPHGHSDSMNNLLSLCYCRKMTS